MRDEIILYKFQPELHLKIKKKKNIFKEPLFSQKVFLKMAHFFAIFKIFFKYIRGLAIAKLFQSVRFVITLDDIKGEIKRIADRFELIYM